jgi:broad specificity phosphatase PhoE
MEIILVRHGKPAVLMADPISGHDVGRWVGRYNEVGITRDLAPPERVRRFGSSAGCVVASDLRRSIESATWLASPREVRIDADLREAVLPESLGMSMRMPPGAWVIAARVAWWLNCCRSSETIEMTRRRASRATDRLCALAAEHGTVLVVGHGMFNRFIATQLLRRGWRGPRLLPWAYWAAATFIQTEQPVQAGQPVTKF